MEKILAVGLIVFLLGGIMMPTGNIILRFYDPSLDPPFKNSTIIDGISIYCDDQFLGKTNKTGFFYYEFEERGEYLLTYKQDGFEDQKAIVYAGVKNLCKSV